MKTWRIKEVDELEPIAKQLLADLTTGRSKKDGENAVVLALHGDLGSGKTTFVQILARVLGVSESVVSPTFVVMKHYELTEDSYGFTDFYHLDAYRIEDIDEMRPLRFSELVEKRDALVVIEWAERIAEVLPTSTAHLSFEIDGDERVLTLS